MQNRRIFNITSSYRPRFYTINIWTIQFCFIASTDPRFRGTFRHSPFILTNIHANMGNVVYSDPSWRFVPGEVVWINKFPINRFWFHEQGCFCQGSFNLWLGNPWLRQYYLVIQDRIVGLNDPHLRIMLTYLYIMDILQCVCLCASCVRALRVRAL